MQLPEGRSAWRIAKVITALLGASLSGCGTGAPAQMMDVADMSAVPPDLAKAPPDQAQFVTDAPITEDSGGSSGLPAGSACTMDNQCAGPGTPRCIDKIRPLATLTTDPGLQTVGVDFPGGYCSTEPSCHKDSDCGAGGTCFWPLQNVSADTLAQLGQTIHTDITAFGQYGVCLKACSAATDCRAGYVCDVPLSDLLQLVPGASISQKFCIGDPVCATCDKNATCKVQSGAAACVCNTGYAGDGKTCTMTCSPMCGANAHCDSTRNLCECDVGYSGDPVSGCSKPVDPCLPNPCLNSGTCAANVSGGHTCTCASGYQGTNCQTSINLCLTGPCANGGTCTYTGPGTYLCNCPAGYSGKNCETGSNACLPTNPCMNGGTCASTGGANYACTCASGYSGTNCETAVNACVPSNPCVNGGTCNMTGPGTYSCSCPAGWTGTNCQIAVATCTPVNPCIHGSCTDNGNGTYSCSCQSGWSGTNCDVPINLCVPTNPCMNGGVCSPTGPALYMCACPSGYSGTNCETPVNACVPTNPCLNGGTCSMTGPGTYSCICPSGYSGINCETPVNACVPINPCIDGGTCNMTGPGTYSCMCPSGYSGTNCETAVNACLPVNPCVNGGTCNMTGPGTYMCMCPSGYGGTNCETPINACVPVNPCMNGGTCNMTGPGTYSCMCPSGYSGTNCENAPTYCDVVYRLNTTAPSAASQFRVVVTGLGAQDTLNTVGNNGSSPTGVTTPFSNTSFPRGFLRLRFTNSGGAPAAGPVQLIEYYMPMEFMSGITGATVTTNIDQSAGLLTMRTTGCPTANYDACLPAGTTQTLNRACKSQGSGVASGTTLTWDTCSLAPPAPPAQGAGQTPNWTDDQSQIPAASVAANPGCIQNLTTFGNITCAGALCGVVPAGTLGVQNSTWDQKFANLVFSGTNYATATIQLPESTQPDGTTTVYDSMRWAAGSPISVTCGTVTQLVCNVQ